MADGKDDEPGKQDTGKKARPKRDRNQPTPKPKKGGLGGLLVKALLAGATAIVILWMGLYSVEVGKGPWGWSGADWGGFVTFSRKQVDDARTQVEQVDWAALGDKITEKTRKLWDDMPAWESKLDSRLAELRGGQPAPGSTAAPAGTPPAGTAGTTTTPATPTTTPTEPGAKAPPAAPVAVKPAGPTELQVGLEALKDGIAHYRRSMRSQSETRAAKDKFREAQAHLGAAMEEADRRHDEKQQAEIDDYLRQANTYFEDCKKRETLH